MAWLMLMFYCLSSFGFTAFHICHGWLQRLASQEVEHSDSRAANLVSSRPCLPDLSCLLADWDCLADSVVVDRVLFALRTWLNQVHVDEHVTHDLARVLHGHFDASHSLDGSLDSCVVRCALLACCACDDPLLAKDLAHQLGLVTRAMVHWAFPPGIKTKKITSLKFDHLLHVVGSVRMLLHTRWQVLAGRRRRAWAKQRLQCVHPDLLVALSQPGPLSIVNKRACASFLATQIKCKSFQGHGQGFLYLLCSVRHCYLGSTACDRRVWRCSLRAPMARFYEHLHDLRTARRSASYAKFLRKSSVFKHVHLGDFCVWVVGVQQLPIVRAMEHCFLRSGNWPANSQCTKAPNHKPIRHSKASRLGGRRCPPRFRENGKPGTVHDHASIRLLSVIQKADRLVRTRAACLHLSLDHKYLSQSFFLTFHSAYWHVCLHRFALTGETGPLDLRHEQCAPLFACYICETKTTCWESIRQRWALQTQPPGSEAIVAMFVLLEQPSCNIRRRGILACDRWLRCHGLPGTRKRRVRWPPALPQRLFHACLHDIRKHLLVSHGSLLARWITTQVQSVQPPRRTYASQWNHIKTCRNMTDVNLFDFPPDALCLSREEGAQMQLCKRYWRTPVWESEFGIAQHAITNLRVWLRSFGHVRARDWCRHIRGWLYRRQTCGSLDMEQHFSYVAALTIPPEHVAVQEDKDKASCWIMPVNIYHKLLVLMVNQDVHHWVRGSGSVADIVESYRQAHVEKLPSHLQACCSVTKWKNWTLPYMYINIKTKCFKSGVGRTCEKPQHACCRRVVSWAAHPCKRLYKSTARALEAAVRLWGKGFETQDLFSAVRDLRAAVEKLNHNHRYVSCCFRCHSHKPPLCAWVGDAAQLFEEVSRADVLQRLKAILAELKNMPNGDFGVVTKKCRRLHFWFARNNFRPTPGAQLHRWDEIVMITELALMQTCVTVGPVLFQQRRGVPIGGFLSKQCASILLGASEAYWVDHNVGKGRWYPDDMDFFAAIAATRYVDDLCLVSSVLCENCLHELPAQIYDKPVCFDKTPATHLGIPWLDVWLSCSGFDLHVHAHGVEQAWRSLAAKGVLELPTKFRLIPFQGEAVMDVSLLLALLHGRLNRWRSLCLPLASLHRAVESELQLWALHGYPLGITLKIWRKGRHCPQAVSHARQVLTKAIRVHGPSACLPMHA